MLFLLVLLFFLAIPIGFGFALAVYLKRVYENPTPPGAGDIPPAMENVLDILNASGIMQDILLAKNKTSEEEPEQAVSEEKKLDEILQENPAPPPENISEHTPEKQEIEQQSITSEAAPDIMELVRAAAAGSLEAGLSENLPLEHQKISGLDKKLDTTNLQETILSAPIEKPPADAEVSGLDFDFETLKNMLVEQSDEAAEKPEES